MLNREVIDFRDPVDWLQNEYSWRKLKNPNYSQRAFAKLLGVGSGRLSEILSGRRAMTKELGRNFSEKLGYKKEEQKLFLKAIESSRAENKKCTEKDFKYLQESSFKEICDWYYLAILNIMTISEKLSEPEGVARRLGLDITITKNAIKKLIGLGLVEFDKGGYYRRTSKPISTTKDIPSEAIRVFQQQILEKAQQAIVTVPAEKRDFSTSFVRLNPRSINKIKDAIEVSRRELASTCKSSKKTEIYALNIQFFPLTQESTHDR